MSKFLPAENLQPENAENPISKTFPGGSRTREKKIFQEFFPVSRIGNRVPKWECCPKSGSSPSMGRIPGLVRGTRKNFCVLKFRSGKNFTGGFSGVEKIFAGGFYYRKKFFLSPLEYLYKEKNSVFEFLLYPYTKCKASPIPKVISEEKKFWTCVFRGKLCLGKISNFPTKEISDPAKFRKSYFLFFFWSVASRARKKIFRKISNSRIWTNSQNEIRVLVWDEFQDWEKFLVLLVHACLEKNN